MKKCRNCDKKFDEISDRQFMNIASLDGQERYKDETLYIEEGEGIIICRLCHRKLEAENELGISYLNKEDRLFILNLIDRFLVGPKDAIDS